MGKTAVVDQPGPETVVRTQGLEKRYRRSPAVRGVDLDIHRGELFGLIGPDGAGKSSVIKCLAGVLSYEGGRVEVFGRHVHSQRSAEAIKGRLGLMPQGLGNNLYAELSVEENIDYFAGLRLVPRDLLRQRKDRLLAMTRLEPFRNRLMKQLSGGMKQKLGLICTLIHEPELVLLDEPTTGVDPVSRRDFWEILTELVHSLNMTCVVSTAYMDEAAYLNRLALFMDGRIVSQGTDEDIRRLGPGTIVAFRCERQIEMLDRLQPYFPLVEGLGEQIRVFVPDVEPDAAIERVAQRAESAERTEMVTEPPDLEDVLALLLSREDRDPLSAREAPAVGGEEPISMWQDEDRVAIRAERLVRDFGHFRAVEDVSFDVRSGEIFGLLGANGAGKTTVIKMLTGLLPPTAGSGSVADAEILHASEEIKERIGYMSQAFSLYPDMTVRENLEFSAGVYGLFPRQTRRRLPLLLRLTGLTEHRQRMTSDLPMGLRQRLALACALVHGPSVVFLDEPTSGVDVLGRRRFWDILLRLAREEGVAVLVTTHYMSEAEHCDTLALMFAGRIVAEGTPQQLRANLARQHGRPLALRTDQPLKAVRLAKQGGFDGATLFGRQLRILSTDHERDRERLARLFQSEDVRLHESRAQPITMEDVFVQCILAHERTADRPS